MKMIQKIRNWFLNHKPLDWKWSIIILLLLDRAKQMIVGLTMFSLGIRSYPNELDYEPIFHNLGNSIGDIYERATTSLFESGLNIGEITYPHNVLISQIISYGMIIIISLIALGIIVNVAHTLAYKKNKSELLKK